MNGDSPATTQPGGIPEMATRDIPICPSGKHELYLRKTEENPEGTPEGTMHCGNCGAKKPTDGWPVRTMALLGMTPEIAFSLERDADGAILISPPSLGAIARIKWRAELGLGYLLIFGRVYEFDAYGRNYKIEARLVDAVPPIATTPKD